MAKKLFPNCLIVILILGVYLTAFSQEISSDDSKTTVYVTLNDINVRESPPSKGLILVGGPGLVAFDLKKDASVIVVDKRVIETVFSKTIWVKVKDLESKKEGWLYWGEEEEKSVNLKLKGAR